MNTMNTGAGYDGDSTCLTAVKGKFMRCQPVSRLHELPSATSLHGWDPA